MRYLFPLVLTLACGGPDFTGTYKGSITTSGNCADTASWPILESSATTWTVVETSDIVTIATSGTCGNFVADATGSTAKLRKKSCPRFTEGASTIQVTYTSGDFTLNGNALTGVVQFEAVASGGTYRSCAGNTTATFIRN